MLNRVKMTAEEQCGHCAKKSPICPIFGLPIGQINRERRRKCVSIIRKGGK